jgi:hypothetical protein
MDGKDDSVSGFLPFSLMLYSPSAPLPHVNLPKNLLLVKDNHYVYSDDKN